MSTPQLTPTTKILSRRSRKTSLWLLMLACAVSLGAWGWQDGYHMWLVYRAKHCIESRQPEAAIEALSSVVNSNPQNAEAHYLLAKANRRLGKMLQVRSHLENALRLGYDVKAVTREQWLAQAQSGQMREAEPHLASLLVNQDEDVRNVSEAYVNGFFLTNKLADAFRLLDVWQADFPDDPQPYVFRGQFFESRTRFADAENAYREALHRGPQRIDLQIRLARCLVVLRKYDEGRLQIDKILAKSSRHPPEVQEILANCLFEQGEAEECRRLTEQLLTESPRNVTLRKLSVKLQLQEGQSPTVPSLLTELVTERPFDLEVRYLYATTLQGAGETKRAADEFQFVAAARNEIARARKLQETIEFHQPANVDLRYQIGEILLKYESPEAGAGWMRSVLEIDPTHQPAHQALADYYQRIRAYEQAQEHRAHLKGSPGER